MSAENRTVYVASKSRYGPMWQAIRPQFKRDGVEIISTWIDECGEGESGSLVDLWVRCIGEASTADALVAYYVAGDEWKGAFVEIGAALAAGKRIILVGDPPGSWVNHPLVHRLAYLDWLPGALRHMDLSSTERVCDGD